MLDQMPTGEMSPREGMLTAQWLRLETLLPCHSIDMDNPNLRGFTRSHTEATARGEIVPHSIVMRPGDWLERAISGG